MWRRPYVHYKFRGAELKTENAAKSLAQPSKWLLEQIAGISPNAVALDYGCGKFRYTIPLSRRVRSVCAVDSSYQVEREQVVAGTRTTLTGYAEKHLGNVSVRGVRSGDWQRRRFDFILCANVLSVIPRRARRVAVLRRLRRVLRPRGRILVSTQFRNTHFKQWRNSLGATWVRDGWFVEGARGASFYAIIPPRALGELCRSAGLRVEKLGSRGETAFAFAGLS